MERTRKDRIFNIARGAFFVMGLYDCFSGMQPGLQQNDEPVNEDMRDITFVFSPQDEERVLDIRKVRVYDPEKQEYIYPFKDYQDPLQDDK